MSDTKSPQSSSTPQSPEHPATSSSPHGGDAAVRASVAGATAAPGEVHPADGGYDWVLEPEEGWERIVRFEQGENTPKFVAAHQSSDRIRVRYYWQKGEMAAHSTVRFGYLGQGPPGFAHGGASAAVLDELMGIATWQHELAVVAAEIRVRYRRPVPLFAELRGRAWVDSFEGKNASVKSTLSTADGQVLVEGSGRFVNIGVEKYREFAAAATKARGELGVDVKGEE